MRILFLTNADSIDFWNKWQAFTSELTWHKIEATGSQKP